MSPTQACTHSARQGQRHPRQRRRRRSSTARSRRARASPPAVRMRCVDGGGEGCPRRRAGGGSASGPTNGSFSFSVSCERMETDAAQMVNDNLTKRGVKRVSLRSGFYGILTPAIYCGAAATGPKLPCCNYRCANSNNVICHCECCQVGRIVEFGSLERRARSTGARRSGHGFVWHGGGKWRASRGWVIHRPWWGVTATLDWEWGGRLGFAVIAALSLTATTRWRQRGALLLC